VRDKLLNYPHGRVEAWKLTRFDAHGGEHFRASFLHWAADLLVFAVLVLAPMSEVTRILSAIEQGNPHATEELLPLVYDELRQLAAQRLAQEKPGQTLEATALVHEAYLRLVDVDNLQRWNSRRHFFAAAAQAMRRILVENARRKRRLKHGGDRQRQEVHPSLVAAPEPNEAILAVDAALAKLAQRDALKARLTELRYFAGLTGEQAAEILGISPSSADRHWVFARAWLRREIAAGQAAEE
jgi:RNA polymerase sigma factor (TIGR02999 family)